MCLPRRIKVGLSSLTLMFVMFLHGSAFHDQLESQLDCPAQHELYDIACNRPRIQFAHGQDRHEALKIEQRSGGPPFLRTL